MRAAVEAILAALGITVGTAAVTAPEHLAAGEGAGALMAIRTGQMSAHTCTTTTATNSSSRHSITPQLTQASTRLPHPQRTAGRHA
ncbi:hypothetical protein E2C01_006889 [Portunus trituberculatus]|uniref:Uncharacterized protein n=1 Tax=Portunus trituberculatus TaxID=210409 RepID=A0A5B7CYJ2_PORTR|nr:hypothetical protein [Portunus trituberculatus]